MMGMVLRLLGLEKVRFLGRVCLALVIFDLDELFDKEVEEIPSPYGFSAFAPITRNVMLSKEGRAIARCIDAEMTKRHYTRLITMHPEEYVYVMLHSGLVY